MFTCLIEFVSENDGSLWRNWPDVYLQMHYLFFEILFCFSMVENGEGQKEKKASTTLQ